MTLKQIIGLILICIPVSFGTLILGFFVGIFEKPEKCKNFEKSFLILWATIYIFIITGYVGYHLLKGE